MTAYPAHFARLGVLAVFLTPAPVFASDFTGFITYFAAASGVVFLAIFVASFVVTMRHPKGPARTRFRAFGFALASAVTIWWIFDPIAEIAALLIVIVIVIALTAFSASLK